MILIAPLVIPAIGAGISLTADWWRNRNRKPDVTKTEGGHSIDPGSQDYINYTRGLGQQGASAALNTPGSFFRGADQRSIGDQAKEFYNPYQDQVIQGVRDQAQYQRGLAQVGTNAAATSAGAFGGSRHAIESATRTGAIDRNASQQIGQLQHQGYQTSLNQALQHNEYRRALEERQAREPLFRHGQALGFANQGYGGPTGGTSFSNTTGPPPNTGSSVGRAAGIFQGLAGATNAFGGDAAASQPTPPAPMPSWLSQPTGYNA